MALRMVCNADREEFKGRLMVNKTHSPTHSGQKHSPAGRVAETLQPDFSPIRINASWAKQSVCAHIALTRDAIENDAVLGQSDHFPILLINNLFDPFQDGELTAAILHHFTIEM